MLASALIRRVQAAGGFAAVLHHGDDHAGAIMLDCVDRGRRLVMLERATDARGGDGWRAMPEPIDDDPAAIAAALDRRLRFDPDMWIIELDIPDAQRLAAETIAMS